MEFGSPSRFLRDIDVRYLQLPHEDGVGRSVDEGAGRFRREIEGGFARSASPSRTPFGTNTSDRERPKVQAGQMIEHERFGLGEVVKVEGAGDNAKATIRFKNAGEKQLLLRFARFKIIG